MKGKVALLIGVGVGYVLGTRAGRERYEQIKGTATSLWQDPKVQQKVGQAQDLAREKGPEVADKVAETARKAAETATAKVKGDDTSPGEQPYRSEPPGQAGPTTPSPGALG